jgi:hypothetical protein
MPHNELLRRACEDRGIAGLCHFTLSSNLDSILRFGLVPRSALSDSRDGPRPHLLPDALRIDGHLNAVNTTIGRPNNRLFYRRRKEFSEHDWVVLRIASSVIWTLDCAFVPTNASSAAGRALDIASARGLVSFELMFEGPGRRSVPTDQQAEVLVFETIAPDCIEAIEFADGRSRQAWRDSRLVNPEPGVRIFERPEYFTYCDEDLDRDCDV